MNYRNRLKDKQKIVVKIGTNLLTHEDGGLNMTRIEKLVRILADLKKKGKDIILVSSGAVGVGMEILGLDRKPEDLTRKQAMAAVGQAGLIRLYQKFFEAHHIHVAQILLTRDGLESGKRRINARNTFNALLEMGIMPIVNENDTVSTEEIEFGDNDTLSAAVAILVYADLLIILTNTDGVYTADPHTDESARKVSRVDDACSDLKDIDLNGKSRLGSGGMASKVAAAEMCREHNLDVIIADGSDPLTIRDILEGKERGTYFVSETTDAPKTR
ncbi:MAG: glutamate 5-kinase [Bacteroidales bacterium]|nr:glutamate 5-kinase [Bacteroidales bacterium]MBN2697615.1 glutamate 5-kinase [Bacteroidales bacterium]